MQMYMFQVLDLYSSFKPYIITHNTLNIKYEKYMIWSMAVIVILKLQHMQVYFKSILSMNNLNVIPT